MSRQELQLGLVPLPGRPDRVNVECVGETHADSARLRDRGGGRSTFAWTVERPQDLSMRVATRNAIRL